MNNPLVQLPVCKNYKIPQCSNIGFIETCIFAPFAILLNYALKV